jgi:hypothetical protein
MVEAAGIEPSSLFNIGLSGVSFVTGAFHSCSVWLRDEDSATISLEFAFEDDRIVKNRLQIYRNGLRFPKAVFDVGGY